MSLKNLLVQQKKGMIYLSTIEQHLLKKQNEDAVKRSKEKKEPAVHPSGIGTECLRNLYYQFFRFPSKPKTAKILKTCDAGTDTHNRYHRYSKEAGILIASELELTDDEYKMRARLDQLVLIDTEDILRLLELKSMNIDKFTKLMGNPHRDHIIQANIYLWIINKMFASGKTYYDSFGKKITVFEEYKKYFPIKNYSIVIENRDCQDSEEFAREYDKELTESVLTKIKDLFVYTDRKELPPRGFGPNDRGCMFCDQKDICWSFESKAKSEVIDIL